MVTEKNSLTIASNLENKNFKNILSENYFTYAISTIISRSLPDVRDGLKPVHRRLLFAMREMGLKPSSGYKKCARVVGDVIGKFHPHGDQAVYDAMVRLAQEFSLRYPLVEGHGNFGSIDGDNAAAMRYTEASVTYTASLLMEGLNENGTDFIKTYDGEDQEPLVLPGAFPNLLANGSNGIAVGMSTSIPSHNILEICDAALYLIKNKDKDYNYDDLLNIIPGPDLPTGGMILETKDNIKRIYQDGKGSFRLRSRWKVESLPRGFQQIIIYEIPFGIQKYRVLERIGEIIQSKENIFISDVKDESTKDIRIVVFLKNKKVNLESVMEYLYKRTELEIRISLNLNVIDIDKEPKLMSLDQVLLAYLNFRRSVNQRKNKYKLKTTNKRIDLLDAYLIVFNNIEKIIDLIRYDDDPKVKLVSKFSMSMSQADAILNMRLGSLRKLEENKIINEKKEILKIKNDLEIILNSELKQWKQVELEIENIKIIFENNPKISLRRTKINNKLIVKDLHKEEFLDNSPVTILCSRKGWVRVLKGHDIKDTNIKYKVGDREWFRVEGLMSDKVIVITKEGKSYTLFPNKLPGSNTLGQPLSMYIDIKNEQDLLNIFIHRKKLKYLLVSKYGKGFLVESTSLVSQNRTGKVIMLLKDNDSLLNLKLLAGDHLAMISLNRKLLIISVDRIPTLNKGRGVILQRYKNSSLSDFKIFKIEDGLECKISVRRRIKINNFLSWQGTRGQRGRDAPDEFPKTNVFDKLL